MKTIQSVAATFTELEANVLKLVTNQDKAPRVITNEIISEIVKSWGPSDAIYTDPEEIENMSALDILQINSNLSRAISHVLDSLKHNRNDCKYHDVKIKTRDIKLVSDMLERQKTVDQIISRMVMAERHGHFVNKEELAGIICDGYEALLLWSASNEYSRIVHKIQTCRRALDRQDIMKKQMRVRDRKRKRR